MKQGHGKVAELWKSKVMKNKFSSSVIVGKHVYGFDNAVLKCIKLLSGEECWKHSGLGYGSLTYADGQLFVLSDRGRLVLVEASPEAYRERGSVEVLDGKCWTVPTLAGGRLYLRNHEEMLCLDVTAG